MVKFIEIFPVEELTYLLEIIGNCRLEVDFYFLEMVFDNAPDKKYMMIYKCCSDRISHERLAALMNLQ